MPITSSAKIALRKDRRRTVVNKRVKNIMKATVKAVKDTKSAETLPKAYQAIDRAAKKNLIHKKKAARVKSQLAQLVAVTEPAAKKTDKSASKKKA